MSDADKPTEHDVWIGAVPLERSPGSPPSTSNPWEDATRAERPNPLDALAPPAERLELEDNTLRSNIDERSPGAWEDSTAPAYPGGTPSGPVHEPPLATTFGESTELDLDLWSVSDRQPERSRTPAPAAPEPAVRANPLDGDRTEARPHLANDRPDTVAQFGRIKVLARTDRPRAGDESPPGASPFTSIPPSEPWQLTRRETTLVVLALATVAASILLITWALLT